MVTSLLHVLSHNYMHSYTIPYSCLLHPSPSGTIPSRSADARNPPYSLNYLHMKLLRKSDSTIGVKETEVSYGSADI